MKPYLSDLYYALKVKALLIFSPAMLFQKISELDWYGDTLQRWVDDHLVRTNMRVLEVGCATGYLTGYIHESSHDITGVDISGRMITEAKKRNSAIDFRCSDAGELPFKHGVFDAVLSASVINISPDPAELIEQVHRVCKPGGRAAFLFPASGFSNMDLFQCSASLGLTGFSKAVLKSWHKTAPKMSISDAEELLGDAGFAVSESKIYLNGMVASVCANKAD